MSFVDDLYKVAKVFPAEIFMWKENNPNYIPRRVFKAMEPEVKDAVLKNIGSLKICACR